MFQAHKQFWERGDGGQERRLGVFVVLIVAFLLITVVGSALMGPRVCAMTSRGPRSMAVYQACRAGR